MNRYFKTSDAKNFAFYKVPKALFEEKYKSVSTDAKMLYGLLLDRMYLSVKNGWILESIRSLADFVKCYESAFLYMLAKKTNLVRQTENKKLRLSVERGGKRISEIDKLIEKVFEQNAAGILSDERFSKLLQNYECEQKRLQTEIEEWKAALDDVGQKVTDLRLLLHTLREITEIKELTPTLVNTLIERIEVHNNDKSSGHCYVKVDVYFTAVGMIDIPTEQEILAMMEEMQKNPQQFRFIA